MVLFYNSRNLCRILSRKCSTADRSTRQTRTAADAAVCGAVCVSDAVSVSLRSDRRQLTAAPDNRAAPQRQTAADAVVCGSVVLVHVVFDCQLWSAVVCLCVCLLSPSVVSVSRSVSPSVSRSVSRQSSTAETQTEQRLLSLCLCGQTDAAVCCTAAPQTASDAAAVLCCCLCDDLTTDGSRRCLCVSDAVSVSLTLSLCL